jgi:hypothetical protein
VGKGRGDHCADGLGQEGDRERSREAGCDGHLVKPVNLSDLEKMLAKVLKQRVWCRYFSSAEFGTRSRKPVRFLAWFNGGSFWVTDIVQTVVIMLRVMHHTEFDVYDQNQPPKTKQPWLFATWGWQIGTKDITLIFIFRSLSSWEAELLARFFGYLLVQFKINKLVTAWHTIRIPNSFAWMSKARRTSGNWVSQFSWGRLKFVRETWGKIEPSRKIGQLVA